MAPRRVAHQEKPRRIAAVFADVIVHPGHCSGYVTHVVRMPHGGHQPVVDGYIHEALLTEKLWLGQARHTTLVPHRPASAMCENHHRQILGITRCIDVKTQQLWRDSRYMRIGYVQVPHKPPRKASSMSAPSTRLCTGRLYRR